MASRHCIQLPAQLARQLVVEQQCKRRKRPAENASSSSTHAVKFTCGKQPLSQIWSQMVKNLATFGVTGRGRPSNRRRPRLRMRVRRPLAHQRKAEASILRGLASRPERMIPLLKSATAYHARELRCAIIQEDLETMPNQDVGIRSFALRGELARTSNNSDGIVYPSVPCAYQRHGDAPMSFSSLLRR